MASSDTGSTPESLNKSHVDILLTIPDGWMLRECQSYQDELVACKSFKGKFRQIYIDGETKDCTQWKENNDDCKLWTNNADVDAAKRIIAREKERIVERMRGHYENDVWEKRTEPPSKEEWCAPLPQYMVDKQEKSYLALWQKNQQERDEKRIAEMNAMDRQATLINSAPSCNIL